MDKIKFLNNETAIKFIEDELVRIEKEIENLQYEKSQIKIEKPLEMKDVMRYARYFFEHLDVLLLQQSNPVAKANFFSLIFTETPNFEDLKVRTPENKKTTEVSDVFLAQHGPEGYMARVRGHKKPDRVPRPAPTLSHTVLLILYYCNIDAQVVLCSGAR